MDESIETKVGRIDERVKDLEKNQGTLFGKFDHMQVTLIAALVVGITNLCLMVVKK